ncbi:hypothetical protein BGZ88_001108 [Linnemannia elongata]|nr:hypothetical protein BGZ88_001108 [Linnemannia elongata]
MVSIGADDVYLSTAYDPKILRVSSPKEQAAPYRRTLASVMDRFGGVKHLESKSSLATDVLTPSIPHPTISLSNDNILSPTSTKHACDTFNDAFDNEAIGLVNTSRNRYISPTLVPTEPLDSLSEVYTARQENHPFQACQYGDEDEGDGEGECDSAGAGDANDVLLLDTTDQVPGSLLFLKESTWRPDFRVSLPTLRRKRSISTPSTKLCNARSGVILLNWEGTESQKVPLGEKTLAQMREKALEKWQETNAMAARNQARIWLDPHKGHGIDSTTELGRSSHFLKSSKTKNANDLVQVEIPLNHALDFIGDAYCVHNAVLVEWQEIGQIIALCLTFKCGNVYFMVHVRDVTIRDYLTELGTIGTQNRT